MLITLLLFLGIILPFKIIKTIEKGKERLTVVPSGWEHNGILRWPGKNVSLKLTKSEKSTPLPDWTKMECTVKRSSIPTYDKAEELLESMLNYSDTSDYPDDEQRVIIFLFMAHSLMLFLNYIFLINMHSSLSSSVLDPNSSLSESIKYIELCLFSNDVFSLLQLGS